MGFENFDHAKMGKLLLLDWIMGTLKVLVSSKIIKIFTLLKSTLGSFLHLPDSSLDS